MISFEAFDKTINFIKERQEKELQINKVLTEEFEDSTFLPYDKYESAMVDLLAAATSSKDYNSLEDIEYFIYELDFGAEWQEGFLTDAKGATIKFQTSKDLYDYITSQQ